MNLIGHRVVHDFSGGTYLDGGNGVVMGGDGYLRAALSSLDGLQPNAYLDGLRAMADFVLHRRK